VLEIDGIDITLAPVKAQAHHAQDLEEQLRSSTVNLANEFLHQTTSSKEEEALKESLLQTLHAQAAPSGFPGDFNSRPSVNVPGSVPENNGEEPAEGEGIQFVAKLIEKLMARIQIICRGTIIRLRHSSSLTFVQNASKDKTIQEKLDYELEIRLPFIHYRDETPGWDQSGPGMDASSVRSTSSGLDSVSGSTMLEESVMPSVIWQDTPESIKTVVFKGFSVWIRQRGAFQQVVEVPESAPLQPSLTPEENQVSDKDLSDSDADVFSDAQENFSQSMMASQMAASRQTVRSTHSAPKPPIQDRGVDLYQAEIFSTLQHRNRVKVNIRKNASVVSLASAAQSSAKSLLDMDLHIRSIFIALSPAHISFIMEIMSLMEHAPSQEEASPKAPASSSDQHLHPKISRDGSAQEFGVQSPPRVDPAFHGALPHIELSTDRAHDQRPISPKRTPHMEQLRALQNKSPGGRPLDRDRHMESRKPRPPLPTPTMYMDASRFLSGSTYSESHAGPPLTASSASAPAPAPASPPALTVKLKARISTFQIFVLYQDPKNKESVPTEVGFYKKPTPEALKADHLKIEMDSMILRYQQWSASSTNGPKTPKSTKGQIDFTLSNFSILEWIETLPRPFESESWDQSSTSYRLAARRQHIPIVEFESDQDPGIQSSPTSKFSTLQVPKRYMTERSITSRMKANKKEQDPIKPAFTTTETGRGGDPPAAPVTKEVVRVRVLLGGKKDSSRPSTPSHDTTTSSGYTRDVTIEVKPLQVHIDLFTFQRMEKCFLAIMGPTNTDVPPSTSSPHTDPSCRQQRPIDQQIIDDLDVPSGSNKVTASPWSTAIAIQCIFIVIFDSKLFFLCPSFSQRRDYDSV